MAKTRSFFNFWSAQLIVLLAALIYQDKTTSQGRTQTIDKADTIVKGQMRPKLSYYISPLWVKIVIIALIIVIGLNQHA
ncbi:MAG: hypothetical protein OIN66_11230 [Candidatus Methanoperedens sp.]|nr:hypothetical protein [Candidatus Methanoperedens sp.]